MKLTQLVSRGSYLLIALALAGCAHTAGSDGISLRMTGAEEVPPVSTSASGTGTLRVAEDRGVSGSFKTQGVAVTAAHIHEAAAGQNGPVIIPLQKSGDNDWVVPPGAKLTDAQFQAYQQGRLYVNFHSAANKGGEIRAQVRPSGGSAPRSTSSGY